MVHAYASLEGRLVRAEEATGWGVAFVDVVGRAITNLSDRPPELRRDGRLLRIEADDGRAASRVLVPGFIGAAQDQVDGRVVFAIPDAGTCLLAGGVDPDDVLALHEAAFSVWHESDRPLSPVVYTKSDDGETFEPLRLDEDHPAWGLAKRAHALLAASVYAEQRASLESFPEAPDLAPFEVALHEARGAVTATVALEEAPALLPATEVVMIRYAGDTDPELVSMETLATARLLVRVPDFDPPRYALVRFPTPAEIASFRAGPA